MTKSSHAAKRQAWAERLERFEQTDQTVAQFCATEGISAPSFYQWRRKLEPKPETNRQAAPRFLPVELPTRPVEKPATVLALDLPGGVSVRLEVHHPATPSP